MKTTNRLAHRSHTMLGLMLGGVAFVMAAPVAHAQGDQLLALDGNKIVRYEYPNGKPIDHFVGAGTSNLATGWNIMYGPDGNLYSSCQTTNAIYRFNGQTGQFIDTFIAAGAGGLVQPLGFAFEGSFVYVTSFTGDSVLQYNAVNGTFVKNFILPGTGTLDGAEDIVFDKAGNAWVTSYFNDKVLKFNAATGAFISEVLAPAGKTMNGPEGLAIDSDGNIFISCELSDNIFKIPAGGSIVELVASGASGLLNPRDMTISPEGFLLVGCAGANKVMGFNRTTGGFTGTFVFDNNDAGLGAARGVAMVPAGAQNCYPDCDLNGVLDIDDFICFQTFYAIGC